MAKVYISDLKKMTYEALSAVGVSGDDISIIFDTIEYANRRGVPTHGVGRLPLYVKKIREGYFNPKYERDVVMDHGAVAVLDAHNGFGQIAAYDAVKMAIEKAKTFGISAVGVKNSNNFGTAGYFGTMAAKEGMAAMIYANASPAIAPTGGNKAIFGTNPLCYAFPNGGGNPIVLDMATTIAARGKIRLAAKNGEKIPDTWAVDKNGLPTDDPNEALKGSLLPMAGYKGYGLSMFVDLFAGVLTGSASSGNVKPLSDMKETSRNGHLFVLIDVKEFMDEEMMKEKMTEFCMNVKACGEEGKVLLPGERGFEAMKSSGEMVTISDKQVKDLNELAKELNISARIREIVE